MREEATKLIILDGKHDLDRKFFLYNTSPTLDVLLKQLSEQQPDSAVIKLSRKKSYCYNGKQVQLSHSVLVYKNYAYLFPPIKNDSHCSHHSKGGFAIVKFGWRMIYDSTLGLLPMYAQRFAIKIYHHKSQQQLISDLAMIESEQKAYSKVFGESSSHYFFRIGNPRRFYVTLPYFAGEDLATVMERVMTEQPKSLAWRMQLCMAVFAAIIGYHRCNLVHGDVKLDNFVLTRPLSQLSEDTAKLRESLRLIDAQFAMRAGQEFVGGFAPGHTGICHASAVSF